MWTLSPKTQCPLASRIFHRALPALLLPLLLLAAVPLKAQPPASPPGPERAVRVVAQFLQLSDQQVEQWVEILQGLHESVQPLAQTLAEREQALADLVQSDFPDPTEVGTRVLEIRELRQEIYGLRQQATADFEALLDDQQLDRLTTLRHAARLARVLPAFKALHLL